MGISFFRRRAEKEGWPKWNIRGCLGMEHVNAREAWTFRYCVLGTIYLFSKRAICASALCTIWCEHYPVLILKYLLPTITEQQYSRLVFHRNHTAHVTSHFPDFARTLLWLVMWSSSIVIGNPRFLQTRSYRLSKVARSSAVICAELNSMNCPNASIAALMSEPIGS